MADSSRPRYVPSKQRRKQQQRFHGAFSGGFSAGYFNTVGSKEGWKPREEKNEQEEVDDSVLHLPINDDDLDEMKTAAAKKRRPRQKVEDFMDEQDHDEWGGPTTVRQDYTSHRKTLNATNDNNDTGSTIEDWMKVSIEPPPHVGNRLLRVLGWREGSSTAYVPEKEGKAQKNTGEEEEEEAKVVLSSKKLRKIQLQQGRIKIPPPKLDACGLGYEPYQNAPEFKAYQEKRRKLAQQRAKLGHSANIYRVNNVLADDHILSGNETKEKTKEISSKKQNNDDNDDVYVSYETVEDFVGQKSVGGFMLRDDEDDAFDDDPTSLQKVSDKVHLDTDEYNDVVYEQSSDDDLDHIPVVGSAKRHTASSSNPSGNLGLAGVLANFAETDSAVNDSAQNETKTNVGVTADGRRPLSGFVLGGSSYKAQQRYPGPDVPLSYQVKRHEFGEDEHPLVLKTLSRAVQLEVVDEKRQKALDEALKANATSNAPSNRLNFAERTYGTPGKLAPMAGKAFVGLAEAMKNRFTSVVEGNDDEPLQAGLRIPSQEVKDRGSDNAGSDTPPETEQASSKKADVKITRTTYSFMPHRLLCKRFHVPAPMGGMQIDIGAPGEDRTTEASYFQHEILNPATSSAISARNQNTDAVTNKSPSAAVGNLFDEDGTLKTTDEQSTTAQAEDRPSMQIYKSIYEPQSEEDEDSTSELEDIPPSSVGNKRRASSENLDESTFGSKLIEDKVDGNPNSGNYKATEETSMVPYKDRDKKRGGKYHSKSRKRMRSRERKPLDRDENGEIFLENREGHERRPKKDHKKRDRSPSNSSSDLSRDSYTSHERRKLRRRRDKDRKEKKRKKEKRKKRSSSSRKGERER